MAWMCSAERHEMSGQNVAWSTLRLTPGEAWTKNERRTGLRRIPRCRACMVEVTGIVTLSEDR